jgi:4-diphosphocytidyl-2-C-methyl-D-erythritol kinase
VTTAPLVVRSFSKINLALGVLGRRPDAYHEIRTIFQTIDLYDELEFHPAETLLVQCDDLPDLPKEENLVWRAAALVCRVGGVERGVRIRLHKRIPMGAGLGGGSGNAAATLLALCRFWQLGFSPAELASMAATLGSDVPFFLHGGTALGVGRGEEVYSLPDFPSTPMVVIFPNMHVGTAEAYRSLKLVLTSGEAVHRIQSFCRELALDRGSSVQLFNDFETSILPAYPAIREAKTFLEERGATASLLSGSGSSVFGFFKNEESALAVARAAGREAWRAFPAKTLSSIEYSRCMFG